MNMRYGIHAQLVVVAMLLVTACDSGTQSTQQDSAPAVSATPAPVVDASAISMDSDDIAGVVSGSNGPEAGVWVIAETDAFETRFAKIVVSDDQGRYLLPDLPAASYQVWVRGYDLADSAKVDAMPGNRIDLTVVPVADRKAAAEIYPAAYWYAMMKLPAASEVTSLPGGVNEYVASMKNLACVVCHQMGNKATRIMPAEFHEFESSEAAWARRISSGQAGANMSGRVADLGGVPFKYLADWTDRIAAGELPAIAPERPAGMERNVVLTVRDWSNEKVYLHDLSGTDRRNPTINSYGPLYGAPELSTDEFPILDPVKNTATTFTATVRDADTPSAADNPVIAPSVYWGDEVIWTSKANAHNPMLDQAGRVWYTARVRGRDNPAFCKQGSEHPSAKLFPTSTSNRQIAVYEPGTGKYTYVDTCFGTHHLQFAEDENNTLWTSGGGDVIGWVDTKKFDETGDAAAAVGWSPLILDTNGNGVRDKWVEPDAEIDPALDKRIRPGYYAVMPNPVDGSVWGSSNAYPGALLRFDPVTGLGEVYYPPLPGFGVRGADIDRNGVIWASMGSGHLGEFDRRKCTAPLSGSLATGDHCPEGWTFHKLPGPGFVDLPDSSVESSYYTWVDQHNTFGLGANVPIVTGNLADGVHALVDGKFITLRLPYPLGFYTKGFEGRIDDANAGWKGRGLWVPSGDRVPWHKEGGKGTKPLVVHFQLRPDPLAK